MEQASSSSDMMSYAIYNNYFFLGLTCNWSIHETFTAHTYIEYIRKKDLYTRGALKTKQSTQSIAKALEY